MELISLEKQKPLQKPRQRLALYAIQKQLEALKLKEYLLMAGFAFTGAALRVPLQVLPSVEPITFFAMLSGWMFGPKKGFATGAAALLLSNYVVMGGQGPWTAFQLAGFGIAGAAGGLLRNKATRIEAVAYAAFATVAFELIMNTASLFFLGFNFPAAFIMSLPFGIAHVLSNSALAFFLKDARKLAESKTGLDEKEVFERLLAKARSIVGWKNETDNIADDGIDAVTGSQR